MRINGQYKQYNFDNGLTVALLDIPLLTTFSCVRVHAGSAHEEKGEEGLAHFIEHCLINSGSEKYLPTDLDNILSNLGYTNAVTRCGDTLFYCQMLPEDIEIWLDVISDIVFNPKFDLARVNSERQTVLREIADWKSDPA